MPTDESLMLGEPTLAEIKVVLERLMQQHRQRRRRYRVPQRPRTAARIEKHQEVAEMVFLWEAVLDIVFPHLKLPQKRLVDWVGRQHGLERTQVYVALNDLDDWQRKQLRTLAEAFAQEWADARS
jgi:hypothetical protein